MWGGTEGQGHAVLQSHASAVPFRSRPPSAAGRRVDNLCIRDVRQVRDFLRAVPLALGPTGRFGGVRCRGRRCATNGTVGAMAMKHVPERRQRKRAVDWPA